MYKNISEALLSTATKFKEKDIAFRYRVNDEYKRLSYDELLDDVSALMLALMELGLHTNDRVGLLSENRIEWIVASFAINSTGAVDVPVFPILSSKQLEYIFFDAEVSAIIISEKQQLDKILQIKDEIPSLRHIIVMDDICEDEVFVKCYSELIRRGEELRSLEKRIHILKKQSKKIKPSDLLTLIYTSGTTGDPKGVMLSHENVISNVFATLRACDDFSNDISLCYLPLCHAYERTTGFYALFFAGCRICLAESVETIATDMQEYQPSVVTTVPRLLETLMQKIEMRIAREPESKRRTYEWAKKIGIDYVRRKLAKKPVLLSAVKYRIARRLVFSKIKNSISTRIRLFFSGGAALGENVQEFFLACGIDVIQGYGLTEASPVVAANRINNNEIGTIGEILDNLEYKIAEDGELLVKGPSVMIGYWKDSEATKNAIDSGGWLSTGDIVKLTDRGNLKITDRKKSIIVNSGGKNIAPQPLENAISTSKYIDHLIVIGERRDYMIALVSPNYEQLESLAKELNIEFTKREELINNTKILRQLRRDIEFFQQDFAKYEKVRKFRLVEMPFSVEGGELSPKMSIKRHIIEDKYSTLINQIYNA